MQQQQNIKYQNPPTPQLDTTQFQNPQLQSLTINQPDDTHLWKQAIMAKNWQYLKILNLQNCCMGQQGCQLLAQYNWSNLHQLYISGNQITAAGIRILFGRDDDNWHNLSALGLNRNQVDDNGLLIILLNKLHTSLKQLYISSNQITDLGIQYINNNNINLNKLTILHLNDNIIGTVGVKYLVRCVMVGLGKLRLQGCGINNEGCRILGKQMLMEPNLAISQYNDNPIGYDGLLSLSATLATNKLDSLNIKNYQMMRQIGVIAVIGRNWRNLSRYNLQFCGYYDVGKIQRWIERMLVKLL